MYQWRRIMGGKNRGALPATSLKSFPATFFWEKNVRKRWILRVEAKTYIVQLTKGIIKNQNNQHAGAFCLFVCLFKTPLVLPTLKITPTHHFLAHPYASVYWYFLAHSYASVYWYCRSNWFILIGHLIYNPLLYSQQEVLETTTALQSWNQFSYQREAINGALGIRQKIKDVFYFQIRVSSFSLLKTFYVSTIDICIITLMP